MQKILTIALGNQSLHMGEVLRSRSGVIVKRMMEQKLPEGLIEDGMILNMDKAVEILESALKKSGIRTKKAIFTLPFGRVMSREIILPEMKEEDILKTIKTNWEEYFPVRLEEYALSYFKIADVENQDKGRPDYQGFGRRTKGKHKGGQRIMALAVPNTMIQSYYDIASVLHLKLLSIDYTGNSIFQSLYGQIGKETSLVLLMQEDHTTLTFFSKGIMYLQRNIKTGTEDIIHRLMEQQNIPSEKVWEMLEETDISNGEAGLDACLETWLSKTERIIEHYRGRNPELPLEKIYFAGIGARIPRLSILMEESLEVPVHQLLVLSSISAVPASGLSDTEAMGYMEQLGSVIKPSGFITTEMEQKVWRRTEIRFCYRLILLTILLGMLMITIPALKFFRLSSEKMELESMLIAIQDVDKILYNYQEAQTKYEDVKAVRAIVHTNNEGLLELVNKFEQICPEELTMTSFSSYDGEIKASAVVRGKDQVVELITQLKSVENISDVYVGGLTSTFGEDGREIVSFSVSCRLTYDREPYGAAEETGLLWEDKEENFVSGEEGQ
ncbi:pilus assembly protein PilM [Lachnospiraceae bacterium 62-35]